MNRKSFSIAVNVLAMLAFLASGSKVNSSSLSPTSLTISSSSRADAAHLPAGLSAEEWDGILGQIRQAEPRDGVEVPVINQITKLMGNVHSLDHYFGYSVAISGDTLVVGRYSEQFDTNAEQGAAYVFARNDGGGHSLPEADYWGLVKQLVASDGAAWDQFGWSVSISGDTLVVGAHWAKIGSNSKQGAAYIFARNWGGIDNWGQVKKLTDPGGAAYDYFGESAAISRDIIVIGAEGDNSGKGMAYIFARNQGGADNWGQVKLLTISDGAAYDFFGHSAAISEDTVVVGAPWAKVGSHICQGAAYIFARNKDGADQWGQVKKLTATDGAIYDYFGRSVSISRDTVVVGADYADVGNNSDQGTAYVFARNQGGADQWDQVKKLTASDGATNDMFGGSVAISGDTIVVGASWANVGSNLGQGAAYAFRRNQGGADQWGQVRKLIASDGATQDRFGVSVATSGDTMLVGAHWADVGGESDQGVAYVFARQGSNWLQYQRRTASDGAVNDGVSYSVAVSKDIVVIGAPYADIGANQGQGAAYVFVREWTEDVPWSQVIKLTASDGAAYDYFGYSVAVSGDTGLIVIGAYGANVGSNGDQGAAYIFYRNPGSGAPWYQAKKLTVPDGAAKDQFGISVAANYFTVVVGAHGDNSFRGAAYIFAVNQGGASNWGLVKKLAAPEGVVNELFGQSVAMTQDHIVVGACGRSAAYVFVRNQGGTDQWGQVKKLTASDSVSMDRFGVSVAISKDADAIVVGASWAKVGSNTDQGAAYIFARHQGGADQWGEVKKLTASDGAAWDEFGKSIAIGEKADTIVVGAHRADVGSNYNQGAAYIFARNLGGADNWGEAKKLTTADGMAEGYFGQSVSISRDYIVVGSPEVKVGSNEGQGAAYFFVRQDSDWVQQRNRTAFDGAVEDQVGYSVAASGDTVVVGGPYADVGDTSHQGAAYIFAYNWGGADNWGLVKKLTSSDGAAGDLFGWSVSISGDTVVIGAYGTQVGSNYNQGAAYVFARNQGGADNWGQVKKLIAFDGASSNRFGSSVAISGDTVVVGAEGAHIDDKVQGAAYIFARNKNGADQWGEVKKLTDPDGVQDDYFGSSVAISGDTVVVGAFGAWTFKGKAQVFARNQGGADNWGRVTTLMGLSQAGDWFGRSVSISGDTIVAGAVYADVGFNRDQGAAYVFARNQDGADQWGLVKKVTTSDGVAQDNLGWSVAIDGDTIVVGADGAHIGGNMDQGAAYIFARNQDGVDEWGQVVKLAASDGAAGDLFGWSVAISGDTVVVGMNQANVSGNNKQGTAQGTAQGAVYVYREATSAYHQSIIYLPIILRDSR